MRLMLSYTIHHHLRRNGCGIGVKRQFLACRLEVAQAAVDSRHRQMNSRRPVGRLAVEARGFDEIALHSASYGYMGSRLVAEGGQGIEPCSLLELPRGRIGIVLKQRDDA